MLVGDRAEAKRPVVLLMSEVSVVESFSILLFISILGRG